ncbi:hypothetical protein SDC9_203746 [bioreactor metagenome]|uniref:Uncharacterized protein n=1 Tax=bioreactor metagenome TaxID=1076179 RepID=A0A645IYT9_9ZZZZ
MFPAVPEQVESHRGILAAADRDQIEPAADELRVDRSFGNLFGVHCHKRILIRLYAVAVKKLSEPIVPQFLPPTLVILIKRTATHRKTRGTHTFPITDGLHQP